MKTPNFISAEQESADHCIAWVVARDASNKVRGDCGDGFDRCLWQCESGGSSYEPMRRVTYILNRRNTLIDYTSMAEDG